MDYENLLKNGIIILVVSLAGFVRIKKFPNDDKSQSNSETNPSWLDKYPMFYDRFYSYPLYVLLFFIGISLIYNGLASNMDGQ